MNSDKKVRLAKKMALRVLLASLTGASLTGCSSNQELLEVPSIEDMAEDFLEDDVQENLEETVKEKNSKFIAVPSVIAIDNVYIRTAPVDGEILGKLVTGHTLERVGELDNGWYKVLYYGQEGYISGDYTEKIDIYKVDSEIQKICYVLEDKSINLTIPEELRTDKKEETVVLPSLECLEIYEETEDSYLVQTNDYIGYIAKNDLEEATGSLTGTFVVVDISDQELKLYENNKVILETPVVTGLPTELNRSDEGLFEIYEHKHNNYLIGKDKDGNIIYETYVDDIYKYNGGEGIHDAEKHHCDNGVQPDHGWRDISAFGGNTYLTNGSHGCVNTPKVAMVTINEHVSLGTRVLVKK